MMIDIAEIAKGKWNALLPQLGIDSRFLNKRNGPCPICGGKDRFRFTDYNGGGGYYCNQCGPGDGFDLVTKITGKTFKEIRDYIMQNAGMVKPVSNTLDLDECRREQAKVWSSSRKVQLDGPVDKYLRGRGINLPDFPFINIRQNDGNMIARVTGTDGSGVNIHRTYLTTQADGHVIRSDRKIMRGEIPKGSAIQLSKAEKVLGIAEGIETAFSAWRLFKVPTWSVISTVGMVNWVPPEETETVVIYADNDANYAGQSAAYALANKLVVKYNKRAEVRLPPSIGTDWNDVLLNQLG
jgi:putative DNA primase/helicase